MTNTPIVNAVNKHVQMDPISFHVPGHKNGYLYNRNCDYKSFLRYDLTELTGLDDLHDPDGVIEEAEKRLSFLYNSRKSFFLVGGSTVGNLAMIFSTVERGSNVIVQRNCHKSVFNGLKLIDANPIFLSPEVNNDLLVAGNIDFDTFKNCLNENKDAKAVILTYPSYYGQAYLMKEMIDLAHQFNLVVLVDEAHGAHFQLGYPFPDSSLKYGADIVVQSAHKTLPAMTMGSWIHVNSDRVSEGKLKEYLGILQSSSPSYPIVMSLDYARCFLEEFTQEDIENTLIKASNFKDQLSSIEGLKVVEMDDPLKIVIQSEKQLDGKEIQILMEKHGVYPELSDTRNVLLILPLLKKGMDYRYKDAIKAISKAFANIKDIQSEGIKINSYHAKGYSKLEIPFSQIEKCNKKIVEVADSVNEISMETIIPYPPGIPLIIQGERITEQMVKTLNEYLDKKMKLQGGKYIGNKEILVRQADY